MGVYPFMFGSINDFEPIAQDIIKVSIDGSATERRLTHHAERPEGAL